MYTEIQEYLLEIGSKPISIERQKVLTPFREFVQQKLKEKKHLRLNFICTHNSRRSHLAQVWAQTIAIYFKLKDVYCYSGGTEATALNQNIIDSLKFTGFRIEKLSSNENPVYSIKFKDNVHPVIGFSKKFDALFNPQSRFVAVMTCSDADENCPFINGAETRFALNYQDPKLFDNTPQQNEKYLERTNQIANEMYWVFKPE